MNGTKTVTASATTTFTLTLSNAEGNKLFIAVGYVKPKVYCDTLIVTKRDTVTLTKFLHDTTYVPYPVHDTTIIVRWDTVQTPYPVYVHDTLTIRDTVTHLIFVHDTTLVVVHDTTLFILHDTTTIQLPADTLVSIEQLMDPYLDIVTFAPFRIPAGYLIVNESNATLNKFILYRRK